MSKKKPNIDAIKNRVADAPEPEKPSQQPEDLVNRIKPETMEQIQDYARAVEEQREAEAKAADDERVELDELPDEYKADADNTYYRGTPADNPEVRRKIEEQAEEMDFADLVLTGRVTQLVRILPGKLEAEFRSLKAYENFWIERQAEKEGLSDWAIRSWMGYARLVLSMTSLNGRMYEEVCEGRSVVDSKFRSKFEDIMDIGEKPIEYLLLNLNWFNDRVEKLADNDFEQLKNG